MTKEEARRLLDAARDGAQVSSDQIRAALMVSGDIDTDCSIRIRRPVGTWERGAGSLLIAPSPFAGLLQ